MQEPSPQVDKVVPSSVSSTAWAWWRAFNWPAEPGHDWSGWLPSLLAAAATPCIRSGRHGGMHGCNAAIIVAPEHFEASDPDYTYGLVGTQRKHALAGSTKSSSAVNWSLRTASGVVPHCTESTVARGISAPGLGSRLAFTANAALHDAIDWHESA